MPENATPQDRRQDGCTACLRPLPQFVASRRRAAAPAAGPCRRGHRRALTLVEVCLVLALLVVIGAVSAPLLEGSFSRAGLTSAADVVRGAWARARLAAMESGNTHVFRFEPKGGRFQIVALNELGVPGSEAMAPAGAERDPADMLRLPSNQLPKNITFAGGDVEASPRVMALLGTSSGTWSSPILFHADGTTSDASLLLMNGEQQTARVTLRGLTGISNTSEVGAEAVAP